MIKQLIEKGRQIKSRGIALTHQAQGYSANNRHVSLLTKSDIKPENLTVEIIKTLEQVQLKISMEEFLRRFFDMWSSDAELLTKVLGMKTEFEQNSEDNPPEDDWEIRWNERHQEYLEDKLSSITLIKKAKAGESLDLMSQYELINVRKQFESGCLDIGLKYDADSNLITPVVEVKDVEKSSSAPATTITTHNSSAGAPTQQNEEFPVENVDVTKSEAFIELQKAMSAQTELMKSMQLQNEAAQEIIKAQKAAKREVAVTKAAGFTFVAAEQREAVADVIENPAFATIVAVLEKAAADLSDKDTQLAAKDTEIAEVKKAFADGKEIGVDGKITEVAKGQGDAQAQLDALIATHSAELAKSTNVLNA